MKHCPHCSKPLTPEPSSSDAPLLASKSTETEAQEMRMLAALRVGPKTTDDFRALGIYQVSARIFHLRKMGYEIHTDLFSGIAADSYRHHKMARYTLVSEAAAKPKEGEAACS